MSTVSSGGLQQHTTGWTDDRVETLKDRWGRGWSAGEIARDLPGFSRCAILGKIDRLKLTRDRGLRKSPNQKPSRLVRSRRATPNTVPPIADAAPLPTQFDTPSDGVGIQLLDLTNATCRWPKGTPGEDDFCFCGKDGADFNGGRPYCRPHAAIATRR